MSNAAMISTHMTREDSYHEALEMFIRNSAEYLDLEVPSTGPLDTMDRQLSACDAGAVS